MEKNTSWHQKLLDAKELGFDFVEISIDETDERLARLDWTKDERESLVKSIFETGIKIEQVTTKHLSELASLPIYDDHRDPNDRMIIAQAISDKVSLISSDRKFSRYCRYGLDFIFNER